MPVNTECREDVCVNVESAGRLRLPGAAVCPHGCTGEASAHTSDRRREGVRRVEVGEATAAEGVARSHF